MLLSIDNALVTSGFAIFDKDLVACGSWSIPAKKGSLSQRISYFLLLVESLCKIYPIDKIAFEDTQQQYNAVTFKHLNYLEGNLEYWCYQHNYQYVILSPSHWRKIISKEYDIKFGRKREEQKKKAMEFVQQHFGIEDISSDSADAVCIGLASIINQEFEDKYLESVF